MLVRIGIWGGEVERVHWWDTRCVGSV
jgi:hypothetical protein